MERKRIVVLGILVLIVLGILVMAPMLAGQLARGTGPGPSQDTSVESVHDLMDRFTIDPAFLNATPHWFIIVAGKEEQGVMIRYIENTSVPGEKKAAWIASLKDIWTAYPVKAVPSAGGALITCDCDLTTMSLTGSQNATLREIEMEIALDMEKSLQTPTPTPAAG
ncbi:MAG: hypothetical protein ABSD81_09145 [Methanomicrobiales archaeon]|jgi:hypothetical protein